MNAAAIPVRPSLRDLGLWLIALTLAVTTLLHYLTDIRLIPSHSTYRSLYYVPIAVAAVRYGRRGGVLAALTASLLYIPHVIFSWGLMGDDGINDLLENAVFLFVGAFAGTLADAERVQRQRAQAAVQQLAAANTALQTQAAEAERMRALMAAILESVDSGVLTLDADGGVIASNRAAQSMLGNTASLPQTIHEYLADVGHGYRQVPLNGRQLGLHASPLVGGLGEAIGRVLVLDDLTEVRALEEQVQRAQRLAALGRLAGGLAHEIRNPLGIIRAAAQMLQRELADQVPLSEYTQVVQTEIDRVDRLIEQLLTYAKPVSLHRGAVDIPALIERTLTLTRAYASQRGVTLTSNVASELRPVQGDAELLHQVLINLLLNGIHASEPRGEVSIEASQECEPTGSAVKLIVRDTGHGIAPGDLPHIFDPFFTTRVDGTGLGLSIVQQIVQQHDGMIEAHSELERGSSFVVRLPA
jgi:two-component system sensor histidine kinase AtoS